MICLEHQTATALDRRSSPGGQARAKGEGGIGPAPGAVLGRSWRLFGPSWGCLGPSWGGLGAFWARLRRLWGRLGALLGDLGGLLGRLERPEDQTCDYVKIIRLPMGQR